MHSFDARIYSVRFFDELMIIYPFYAVMFVEHGMSPMQVSLLIAGWCLASVVFEVPSGALADRCSRKKILFFGQILRAAGFGVWTLFPQFWGFLLGFLLWGIKGALWSGTFEALVYDELKRQGRAGEYVKVGGRAASLGLVAVVLSAIAASAVFDFGSYPMLLVGSIVAVMVCGALVLTLPAAEPSSSADKRSYLEVLHVGVRNALTIPGVMRLILFAAVVMVIGGTLDEYLPLFMTEAGAPHTSLGLILALFCGVQALANFLAHRFYGVPSRWFYVLFSASGLMLLAAGWLVTPLAMVFLLLFAFIFQTTYMVFDGKLQHAIPSDTRATVASVRGFVTDTAGIVALLGMGWIVGDGFYSTGFMVFGGVAVVVGSGFLLRRDRLSQL